jgi:hypothetical protein
MSKPKRALLGFITILPALLCWGLPLIELFVRMDSKSGGDVFWRIWQITGFVIGFAVLLLFGLLAYYLWHLRCNTRISIEDKMLWVAALIIGHGLVMPVYWYKQVWRQNSNKVEERS